ncbi:unnamed protein product [Pleuronectes platessa]|uniref:Uncharacterized protein n=1 Tax=Pleuronectes platessa TaxID=8262 RepID=A0A9N7UZC0_PLEPL|nr:unnamed protein product [Pleuronectes platessa]
MSPLLYVCHSAYRVLRPVDPSYFARKRSAPPACRLHTSLLMTRIHLPQDYIFVRGQGVLKTTFAAGRENHSDHIVTTGGESCQSTHRPRADASALSKEVADKRHHTATQEYNDVPASEEQT